MDNHNENHISNTLSDYDLIDLQRKEKQSEINQLKDENERLRKTLREIANSAGIDGCGYATGEGHADCVWKARKALNEVKL